MNCKVLTPEAQALILSTLIDAHTKITVNAVCNAAETQRPYQVDPLEERLLLAIDAVR